MAAVILHLQTSVFTLPLFASILRLVPALQCTPVTHGNLHSELSKIPHGLY